MFLRKKQANGGTDDVLQQIKEKISDASGDGSNLNGKISEQASTSQSMDNADVGYNDEDDELLNMLLSDDNEDDEEEDDNDDLNELLSKSGTNSNENDIKNYGKSDIVSNVNTNKNEDIVSSYADHIDNENNDIDDENVEELDDTDDESDSNIGNNRNVSLVDDVVNELKDAITDDKGNDSDSGDVADIQTVNEEDIDEDDIEFYDKNGDDGVDGNEDETVTIENGNIGVSSNDEEPVDDEDYIKNDDNISQLDIDEGNVDLLDSSIDNIKEDIKPLTNEASMDAKRMAIAKPSYGKQKSIQSNVGLDVVSISENTRRSVRRNISNLIEQVKRRVVDERDCGSNKDNGGKTLEQIAIDLIRPVVIDYLNDHLERIVSDIVSEEIRRITDDVDR
ncbi:MAG: DUF2497 domain-containing protein [Rickettsiales bacterium]|nr:DUF2497 domain-containing protein [Rickettsiales bacterium]